MSAAQPSIKARHDVHLDEGECRLCKHAAMPSGERSAPSATQCAFVSSSHDGRGAVRQVVEEQEVHTTSPLRIRDTKHAFAGFPHARIVAPPTTVQYTPHRLDQLSGDVSL